MRGMFSVAQKPRTYVLSQVLWPVSKLSKHPLTTNFRVGTTRTTTDNTKKPRKGTSWSSRLDKITNNVITHNTVGCDELTAMVKD